MKSVTFIINLVEHIKAKFVSKIGKVGICFESLTSWT